MRSCRRGCASSPRPACSTARACSARRCASPIWSPPRPPGVLPKTPMVVERGRLVLRFDNGLAALAGERLFARLRQLARLIGREPVMETD